MIEKPIFASAVSLGPSEIKKLKISDPYSVHRLVYSLFSDIRTEDEKSYKSSGFLYADQGMIKGNYKILILSERKPQLTEELAEHSKKGQREILESKIVPDNFLSYSNYAFCIQINPTRCENKTRKRMPIKNKTEIINWFCQRSREQWGFTVLPDLLEIDKVDVLDFKSKNDNRITLSRASLRGVLLVEDRIKFELSVRRGIGRAKAFGCGLLQIVPQIF